MARSRNPRPRGLIGQLGVRVEGLRKERGWSVHELARKAGIGHATVIRVEAGTKSPSVETVRAIAHALGLSAAAMMAECPDWESGP